MAETIISVSSLSDVVTARSKGRAEAERAGFTGTDATVISAVISEMARMIAESSPGELGISLARETGKIGIEVVARTYLARSLPQLFFIDQLRSYLDECRVSYRPGETAVCIKKWVDVWTEPPAPPQRDGSC
ncbi:MAG: hypothetical protein HY648_02925 [Acidobacteria bacterium]|nr:hypothetical protein [Acidobacteriota bacterium]